LTKSKKYCEECGEEQGVEGFDIFSALSLPQLQQPTNVLEKNNLVFLTGTITEELAKAVIKQLWTYHFTEENSEPIRLIINSPGGYSSHMWAVIDTMGAIKNEVHTIGIGELASAGAMIFVAGDVRKISENTTILIHNFFSGAIGSYPELVAARKGQDLEYKKFVDHLLRYSKYISEADVKKYLLKDQDYWLSPKELKAHGLTDVIYKNTKRDKSRKKGRK
jgi:ATP-dependent Clp protease protease subunit